MGNLVTYAAERRGNPDEGMGVGLEGSRWDSGEEAGRGGGEKRGSVQRRQEYLVVREYATCIEGRDARGRQHLLATPLGSMT